MSGVNIPLLRKAVEWAEAEAMKPKIDCRWDQSTWVTPADNRAVLLLDDEGAVGETTSGAPFVAQVAAHCGTAFCIAGYVAQMLDPRYAHDEDVDGVPLGVFAAEALGIPGHHADAVDGTLFSGFNTIADVRRIAEDLAGERL